MNKFKKTYHNHGTALKMGLSWTNKDKLKELKQMNINKQMKEININKK